MTSAVIEPAFEDDAPAPEKPAGNGHAPAHVRSVAKAARILRCFDAPSTTLTVRAVAERTGLPRSTCHAICNTLVTEKMLQVGRAGGYTLGPELMLMGAHVVARSGLVDAAIPTMNALAASTRGEAHLGQLGDDGNVVYLHRVRTHQVLHARNWFGMRVPAHQTGCGKAALSAIDPRRARDMALARGLASTGAGLLLDELELVRRTGFVIATSFQSGLGSVAAPVVAPHGRVVGGLSVVDRRETLTRQRVATLGAAVRDAADVISRQVVGPSSWI